MKLRFLCGPHRLDISNNPVKAINCFQNSFDMAQNMFEQGLYKEAIPYIGCAFETAEIILTVKAIDSDRAGEFFTASAVMFGDACAKIDYMDQALEIYWMAIDRLERELSLLGNRHLWINRHLKYFYESVQSCDFSSRQAELSNLFMQKELSAAVH